MSHYQVDGPAVISFSGGRTSGYMLKQILDAHGGALPSDVHVCFANTGKERNETLDFVRDCGERWGVQIHWLEYRRKHIPVYRKEERKLAAAVARAAAGRSYLLPGDEAGFIEVTYETASRCGEPFENLIDLMALPNVTTRMCSQELKVRVIKKWMMARGYGEWTNVVGIRLDEPRRVARMRAPTGQRWENQLPLADAGATKAHVLVFWSGQDFDLQLPVDDDGETYLGNCDLCFLKSTPKRLRIAKETPDAVAWWIEQERRTGMRFRDHRSGYDQLHLAVACAEDDLGDCVCHD